MRHDVDLRLDVVSRVLVTVSCTRYVVNRSAYPDEVDGSTRASPTQVVDDPDIFLYLHHDRVQSINGTLVVFPDRHGGSYVLPRQWYKIFQH